LQLDRLQSWLRGLYSSQTVSLCVIVSALVSFAGPFGTYAAMHWPMRMVFWVAVTLFSLPFAKVCRTIIGRRMRAYDYWWRALAICAAFATVYAPFVYLQVCYLLWLGYGPFVPVEVIWLAIFLTAMALSAMEHLSELEIPAPLEQSAAPELAAALPNEPRLMARLGQEVRGAILSLSVRDHYVEVWTERGTESLLMRFADAMAELDGIDGMQVHRSHWVAVAAVVGAERERGKTFLRLSDGRLVPVSRSYKAAVEARGLL
jgi:hypothetical protein